MQREHTILLLGAMLAILTLAPLIWWLLSIRNESIKLVIRLNTALKASYEARSTEHYQRMELQSELNEFRERMIPRVAEKWLAADVQAWQLFLKTPTGQKLLACCREQITHEALVGCNDAVNTVHSAARAAGADWLLRYQFNMASNKTLEEISRPTGDQVEIPTVSEQSEADLVARFSP